MPYHLQKRRQRHSKQTLAMAFRLSASGAPAPSEARFFVASTWSIAPFFLAMSIHFMQWIKIGKHRVHHSSHVNWLVANGLV